MSTWLFRATLDQTATKGNWTSLLPTVSQTGLGDYCERDVVVPSSWAGQKGVIGIVQDAPDGILYQVGHGAHHMLLRCQTMCLSIQKRSL